MCPGEVTVGVRVDYKKSLQVIIHDSELSEISDVIAVYDRGF
jgi:hypothetical protein